MLVFFTFKLRNESYLKVIKKSGNKLRRVKLFKLEFKTTLHPVKGRISFIVLG